MQSRNSRILNFFSIVCVLLSIASAVLGVIKVCNAPKIGNSWDSYNLSQVRYYMRQKEDIGRYFRYDNSEEHSYELDYDAKLTDKELYFYQLDIADAMLFDRMNDGFNHMYQLHREAEIIRDVISYFGCSLFFMMFAIFLKPRS